MGWVVIIMVLASHYIFMDVLSLLERNRTERLEEVCTGYSKRYSDDDEFQELISIILTALEDSNNGVLDELKPRIRNAIASRRIETSGGTKLWFKNRRASHR